MDKIDAMIRAYLEQIQKTQDLANDDWMPDMDDFYRYLSDGMEGEELSRMIAYLERDPLAQQLVRTVRSASEGDEMSSRADAPKEWVQKTKEMGAPAATTCPHCGKGAATLKSVAQRRQALNVLWLALAVLSFSASFVFSRRFIQFLALALFFGLLWILERRAIKAQIMVHKVMNTQGQEAEREHGQHSRSRL